MNSTVQKGGYFDVWAEQYSPNETSDGFRGIVCGYNTDQGYFIPMTDWDFFASPTAAMVLTTLPTYAQEYSGRVKIQSSTIMRINNADFADEGRNFSCRLTYKTGPKTKDLIKPVLLETVFGKKNNFQTNIQFVLCLCET